MLLFVNAFTGAQKRIIKVFWHYKKKQNLADEDAMFAETDGENDLEWSSMGYGGLGNTMGFFNID